MVLQESHLPGSGRALSAKSLSRAATLKEEEAAVIQMLRLANPLALPGRQVAPAVRVIKISSRPRTRLSFQHHAAAARKGGILETLTIMLAGVGPLQRAGTVF